MTTETKPGSKSRMAVIGMLADLHELPAHYDVKALGKLVKDLHPDLLCAEIHLEDWRAGDLSSAPVVYRAALVPQARKADIVIIPIGVSNGESGPAAKARRLSGWRSSLTQFLNRLQRWLERLAGGPAGMNSDVFDAICDGMCAFHFRLSGLEARRAWEETNRGMVTNILAAIRRDPGRRVLVTVDCRRRRWLERQLRLVPGVELVHYHQF